MPVWHIEAIELTLSKAPLPYALSHRDAIALNWERALADNPSLYDGEVFLVGDSSIANGRLAGLCHRARFSAVLHLRDHWSAEAGVSNAFGSAILRGSDGGFVLGEMAAHTANAGRIYFLGGILDDGDLTDQRIDPTACILRELSEETGLGLVDLTMREGFIVAADRHALGIGKVFGYNAPAKALAGRIRKTIATQQRPELVDVHVLHDLDARAQEAIPAFTRLMIDGALMHEA